LSAQTQAADILAHYLRFALANHASSDLDAEVAHAVQLIVDAAVEAVKEEASGMTTSTPCPKCATLMNCWMVDKPLRFRQVGLTVVQNLGSPDRLVLAGVSEAGEVYIKAGDSDWQKVKAFGLPGEENRS